MGMFDHLRCELPLPKGAGHVFQTKDLGCDLATYKITVTGRLLCEQTDYTPLIAAGYGEGQPLDLVQYEGTLTFYDSTPEGGWIEYDARFENGVCIDIKDVSEQRHRERWRKG